MKQETTDETIKSLSSELRYHLQSAQNYKKQLELYGCIVDFNSPSLNKQRDYYSRYLTWADDLEVSIVQRKKF